MEGHGEKPQALGQGLDIEFLAGTEAPGKKLALDLLRQGRKFLDFGADAHLPGQFPAHGMDVFQGFLDQRLVFHGLDPPGNQMLDFVTALDRVGIVGFFLEFVPVS